MYVGLICLSNNIPGTTEFSSKFSNTFFIEDNNIQEFERNLNEISNSNVIFEDFAKHNRELIIENYTSEKLHLHIIKFIIEKISRAIKVNLTNFQVSLTNAAIASILLSILLNWVTFRRTKYFVPRVRKNEKRLSSKYVPPFGGIACSIAFLISSRLLGQADDNFIYIGFFAVIISIVGLLDDLYNFSWYIKLIFQIITVYVPLYNLNIFINFESLIGIEVNNYINYIVSTIWIMLIMNAINFVDNMDGLAVVVSSAICLQIAVLTNYLNQYKLTDISILLLCAIGGFLFFNFPPAKLYFGDSGSLFIGFCLGFMSILYNWVPEATTVYTSTLSPILLIFSVPLLIS